MKKKLMLLLAVLFLAASACSGYALAYMTETLRYDQISGKGYGPPARAERTISVLREGDYPGLSDVPVTAEEAAPGRAALKVLRGQRYTRALPFLKPAEDGIAVRECIGCSPWCIAYWDGACLWLPGEQEGKWLGYAPSDPEGLGEALETLCR